MNKICILFFAICVFIGCNSNENKNEDSIALIRRSPNSICNSVGDSCWFLTRYVEYKFNNKDSLLIGVSTEDFFDNFETYDFTKPFHFGLDKFYMHKIDEDFSKLMTQILNGEYKESYRVEFEGLVCDDREHEYFVINKGGKHTFISYSEKHLLPEALQKFDSLIESQINLPDQEIDNPNYSLQIILNLQDIHRQNMIPVLPPPLNYTPPTDDE